MTIRPGRLLLYLLLMLIAWVAILALVMRISGEAPAALVMLPPDGMISALPPGISVVGATRWSVTVKGGDGLVRTLYDLGAPLVLPSGLQGCIAVFSRTPQ